MGPSPTDVRTATGTTVDGDRHARLALLTLVILLLVAGALRIWYLPSLERIGVEGTGIVNIESMLADGEIRRYTASPLAWYPQLLAVGLADRLGNGTADGKLPVVTAKGRVTRRGLHLARFFSVLYGVAGIGLLYPIARRLYSPTVALLALLILCFSPWHIQGSVTFAPEILVLALSTLALWLGLRALDRPSTTRFTQVGVALGIAAAADVSGALIAVPVLVGLLAGGRHELRRILLPLAITVPVAVVIWWALSPPLGQFMAALEVEQASQIRRAAREMSSRFTVAVLGFLHPLRESVHGRLLGGLAVLGAAGQAFRCLFLVDPGPARVHRLMVLAAAPVFILGCAWATPLYRESGFVPLVAFSSLYAAVMLGILWDGLVALVPRLASPRAAAAAAAVVGVLVVPLGWRFVHSKAVDSTIGVALDWLREDLPAGGTRLVIVEEASLGKGVESFLDLAQGLAVQVVPRLVTVGEERLARADGEVFVESELEGADGDFYRGRGHGPARRKTIAGNVLWKRGPDLVAVQHGFDGDLAEQVTLAVEQRNKLRAANVPAAADRASFLSLLVQLPPTVEFAPVAPRARLGGAELDLALAGRIDGKLVFVSERLPTASRPRRLTIEPPPWMSARRGELTVAMYLWR